MAAFLFRSTLADAVFLASIALMQTIPVTTLSTPLAEFPEGYTSLEGLRELPDGRVLTVERCDRVVKLLDLGTGVEQQVGRTGAGPGEYRIPGRLFALPGDSTAVYDAGNRRFLMIHPEGKPGRFFDPIPAVQQSAGGVVAYQSFNPTTTDAQGRFYAREGGVRATEGGLVRFDSVAIERWDQRTGRRDTIAFFRLAGGPGPIVPLQEVPFTTGIQWAAATDGRVALVHPGDYHVEFVGAAGMRSAGKPIRFDRIPVSEGHKARWREEQKPACGRSATQTFTGPDGRPITATRMQMPEPGRWPEVLPPFLSGAAMFAPDGILWVRRTGAADAAPLYDLIDGRGNLVHRVVLPRRARVLGFGKGSVYVVRLDEDDLQYLQRYRLPKLQ